MSMTTPCLRGCNAYACSPRSPTSQLRWVSM